MPRIMPEGWRMHQGVGLFFVGCLGWHLGEYALRAAPGALNFAIGFVSRLSGGG